jgi:ketosteroid isomerase-like protein
MSATTETARRLYDALAARDGTRLLAVLDPAFQGDVSDGMPLGVGGHHDGAHAMLAEVWGPVFARYDVAVRADELLECGPDCVVALGRYVGRERLTDRPVDAAFAHVLTIRAGRVTALRQITDTRRWPDDDD